MTTVLFWDIDGTLLTTARAGVFALEEAAGEILGASVDLTHIETAGRTDRQIAADILERQGMEPDQANVERLLRLYGSKLPRSLMRKQGSVLRGVREILDHIRGREDVLSLLLTGNIEAGARAKLAHCGLDGYFTHGAFADDTRDRAAIARTALAVAEGLVDGTDGAAASGIDADKVYVIGDTPHDINCGKAIDARVVAVASGAYDLAALEACGPWWALPHLPEPEIFCRRLGLGGL